MLANLNENFRHYYKPILFACPLFRDLGDVAKITGREYSKSHHLLVHLL